MFSPRSRKVEKLTPYENQPDSSSGFLCLYSTISTLERGIGVFLVFKGVLRHLQPLSRIFNKNPFGKGKSALKHSFKLDLLWHFAIILIISLILGCQPYPAFSEPIKLTASWYSIESLKREGTYKTSKGVMANGQKFNDNNFTCATRLFSLGAVLRITNLENDKSVNVIVTDRISKKFGKTRIDLAQKAFSALAPLSQGLILCKVERI